MRFEDKNSDEQVILHWPSAGCTAPSCLVSLGARAVAMGDIMYFQCIAMQCTKYIYTMQVVGSWIFRTV